MYWALYTKLCRSQWPRGPRRRSATTRLLRLWGSNPAEVWMSVCSDCCVLTGKCLCDELITRPEESYRLWCVVVCDLETSSMRRLLRQKQTKTLNSKLHYCAHKSHQVVFILNDTNHPTHRYSSLLEIFENKSLIMSAKSRDQMLSLGDAKLRSNM